MGARCVWSACAATSSRSTTTTSRQRVEDIAHVVQRVQRTLAGRRSEASLLDVETVEDKVIRERPPRPDRHASAA